MGINGRLSFASLCSGVGGLDKGFIGTSSFEVVFGCDIDAWARRTYRENHGFEISACSLAEVAVRDLKSCEVVVAGPPCQGFSSIGKRDVDDRRNSLMIEAARLIAVIRPSAFILENVPGLRWVAGGAFLTEAKEVLSRAGLVYEELILDCSFFGVPQRRRRLLLVGGKGRLGQRFSAKAKSLAARGIGQRSTVRDALLPVASLHGLPNHEPRDLRVPWHIQLLKSIGPGQKLCDTRLGETSVHSWELPEVFGTVSDADRVLLKCIARLRRSERGRPYEHVGDGRPVRIRDIVAAMGMGSSSVERSLRVLEGTGFVVLSADEVDLRRRFNGRFRRLPLDGLSPAVLREFESARGVVHPLEARGLTVRECARLQGFGDRFEFFGSRSKQFQLVANAFPPPVSHALARELESCL